jgi:hypothetical protein
MALVLRIYSNVDSQIQCHTIERLTCNNAESVSRRVTGICLRVVSYPREFGGRRQLRPTQAGPSELADFPGFVTVTSPHARELQPALKWSTTGNG